MKKQFSNVFQHLSVELNDGVWWPEGVFRDPSVALAMVLVVALVVV